MRMRFGPGFPFGKFHPGLFAMGCAPRGWGDWEGGEWAAEFGTGRGRRRKRVLDSGELRLVLLKLIADQPRHGYDLIRAVEELTEGRYAPSPGVIYPTLTMLQDMGLIEEAAADGARKVFAVTGEGEAHLAERAEEVEALFARLAELGAGRRARRRPIQRAVGNLLSALWHRITGDEMDEERLHEIAAILDEAAQRIERLK
jgi:DNA-binding PadR family transcriptional regulator